MAAIDDQPETINKPDSALQGGTEGAPRRTPNDFNRWAVGATVPALPSHALGDAEINAFLSQMAKQKQVSASTQKQSLAALLFLLLLGPRKGCGQPGGVDPGPQADS